MATSDHASPPRLGAVPDWIGTVMRYRSEHPAAVRILDLLERLLDRPYRTHALLYGEPGTGKEGLARALHAAMHPGGEAPFVKIPSGGRDPAILSRHLFGSADHPGAIERADGGTLFLDEVSTLPREVQARLGPALRGRFRRDDDERPRPCDVLVVGSTDHDLARLVREGRFRHDLYHRLARIELSVPPLRARPEDIPRAAVWMANRVLSLHAAGERLALEGEAEDGEIELGADALEVLRGHQWPGNFRELDLVIERAVMLYRTGRRVDAAAIRAALTPPDMPLEG